MAIFSALRNPWQSYWTLNGPPTSALQTSAQLEIWLGERIGRS
jgi:hypothetical protein